MSLAVSVFLAAAQVARAAPIPSSTDEARAVAGASLPTSRECPPLPRDAVSSTDEARALAAGRLERTPPIARLGAGAEPPRTISSTDEARALAGLPRADATAKELLACVEPSTYGRG